MKLEFRNPKIAKFETNSKIKVEYQFFIPNILSPNKYYTINFSSKLFTLIILVLKGGAQPCMV